VFASRYKVNYGAGHMDDCTRDKVSLDEVSHNQRKIWQLLIQFNTSYNDNDNDNDYVWFCFLDHPVDYRHYSSLHLLLYVNFSAVIKSAKLQLHGVTETPFCLHQLPTSMLEVYYLCNSSWILLLRAV